MTLTPDASRPEDNDKLRKDNEASAQDPAVPSPYGYDNAGYGAPQAPSTPPASPYSAPQGQYPSYAPPSNNAGNQGMYSNPGGHVPQEDMWTTAQKPQNMSTILGSTSIGLILLAFLVGPFAILSPVAAIFGILQGNKASRLGVNATLGKVLSWIGLGLNVVGLLLLILFFGIFAAAIGAGVGM